MADRSRSRRYSSPPRGAEAPPSQRQANFITLQILLVLLLLCAVWAAKHFQLKAFETFKSAANLLWSTDAATAYAQAGYEKLERLLGGEFDFGVSDALGPLGVLSSTALSGMGGAYPGALDDGAGTPTRPRSVSQSPMLLTAQPHVPVAGKVTSAFGWRENPTAKNAADFHTGLDIAATEGTPIFAALPGTVADTGYSDNYGNFVHIAHAGGLVTSYSHCSVLIAKTGERIRQGERIALVGSTGNSTGPHVHFEIRQDEIAYDPLIQLLPPGKL